MFLCLHFFFFSKVVVGFKFIYTKEKARWKKRDQALRNRTRITPQSVCFTSSAAPCGTAPVGIRSTGISYLWP